MSNEAIARLQHSSAENDRIRRRQPVVWLAVAVVLAITYGMWGARDLP